ncbi:hypothetical protein O1L68_41015 [Streptomyces lydicus]|nr:hypothetical protein [Streptomyces lydicus]
MPKPTDQSSSSSTKSDKKSIDPAAAAADYRKRLHETRRIARKRRS